MIVFHFESQLQLPLHTPLSEKEPSSMLSSEYNLAAFNASIPINGAYANPGGAMTQAELFIVLVKFDSASHKDMV